MKATKNFFARKRAWSQLKDEILACYLTLYIAKLLKTRGQIIIADCFAGKGRFDDGKDGSPIIIASAIADALERNPSVDIEGVFVEKKYFPDLTKNLEGYKLRRTIRGRSYTFDIIDGAHESSVGLIGDGSGIVHENHTVTR